MRKLAGLLAGVLCSALMFATPAMAQEKKAEKAVAGKATVKEIAQNDKVRVFEAILKPGDEGANVERPVRVVRALKGGTIQRTWADGKKDTLTYKDGEVKLLEADKPFLPKNIGKTTIHLYIVQLKGK